MKDIILPYNFTPRPYQKGIFEARDRDVKNILCVWHRRAGKDKSLLNLVIREAFKRRGAYYYYFPTGTWARKAIWNGMDRAGLPFKYHFPKPLIKKVRDQDMIIEFVNGSIFQIIGTDNLDVVGVNPVGCVFSEYSLQNPQAYKLVSPIFAENDGWCAFNYTPRGKNHGWELLKTARKFPEYWYCEVLDIEKTGAIDPARVERDIKMGIISQELAEQEYYCSFDFGMEGSILGEYVRKARKTGRIGKFSYRRDLPTFTFWDIGVSDATSVWIGQYNDSMNSVYMIDHIEENNKGVAWFNEYIHTELPYSYNAHFAPHDAVQRDKWGALSLAEQAERAGLKLTVIERTKHKHSDIELMRRKFDRFFFDEEKCEHGLICLNDWHWNEKGDKPEHDWTSHAVDAFAIACRALDGGELDYQVRKLKYASGHKKRPRRTVCNYDPLTW